MAKIYKVELYFTDVNNEFSNGEEFGDELKKACNRFDGLTDVTNVDESKRFVWHDNLKINRLTATKEDYDKYFDK